MPYNMTWNIEKHILEAKFWGDVAEAEMHDMSEMTSEMLAIGESPLYLIVDMYDVTKIPLNFNDQISDIASFRSMPRLPDRLLIVSSNSLLRFFGVLVSKVMTLPMTAFKTREEVDQFIKRQPEMSPLFKARE